VLRFLLLLALLVALGVEGRIHSFSVAALPVCYTKFAVSSDG